MEASKIVLAIDDEKMIEGMVRAVVESYGCTTSSFTDPQHVLRFLINNRQQVILIISNFRMPFISGPTLSGKLFG